MLLVLVTGACVKTAPNSVRPGVNAPGTSRPVVADPPTPTPVLPPALSGDIEIQQLLLTSHARWKTLAAGATTTSYPPAGVTAEPQVTSTQLWIELPARSKVISGPPQAAPTHIFISDGTHSRWENDPIQPLPEGISDPFNPPAVLSDTIYTHPLAGMLGTPIADLIFPAGLAQRGGEYRITGKETAAAAREAYVVEWGRDPGELIDRFWVDTQTGIILRHQNYGKENSETPVWDASLTHLVLDGPIPPETFNLDSPDLPALAAPDPTLDPGLPQLRILSDLDLVNVRSAPNTEAEILVTLAPKQIVKVTGKNSTGDWYQVEVDGKPGWVFAELVEVKGDPAAIPVVLTPE